MKDIKMLYEIGSKPAEVIIGIVTPNEGWKPSTFYKVRMSWVPSNPVHHAMLITDVSFHPKLMQGIIWNPQTGCQDISSSDFIQYLEVEHEISSELL